MNPPFNLKVKTVCQIHIEKQHFFFRDTFRRESGHQDKRLWMLVMCLILPCTLSSNRLMMRLTTMQRETVRVQFHGEQVFGGYRQQR